MRKEEAVASQQVTAIECIDSALKELAYFEPSKQLIENIFTEESLTAFGIGVLGKCSRVAWEHPDTVNHDHQVVIDVTALLRVLAYNGSRFYTEKWVVIFDRALGSLELHDSLQKASDLPLEQIDGEYADKVVDLWSNLCGEGRACLQDMVPDHDGKSLGTFVSYCQAFPALNQCTVKVRYSVFCLVHSLAAIYLSEGRGRSRPSGQRD